MKQDWHPDELAQHWTISTQERELLGNKTGATRLSFAILLKSFQQEGRFPDTRDEVAASVVNHLAIQTGVPGTFLNDGDWSERTQRYQRAQIREHCGFRVFHAEDEPALVQWLSGRVASPNPEAEEFRLTAYEHLREQHVEPPGTERLRRLLRMGVDPTVVSPGAILTPHPGAHRDSVSENTTMLELGREPGGAKLPDCRPSGNNTLGV